MLTCSRCKRRLPREGFSNSQLKKAQDKSSCKDCMAAPTNGSATLEPCGLLGAIVQCLPTADVAMPDADFVERMTPASLAIVSRAAAAAGLPPIDVSNARLFEPPDLREFRGRHSEAKRNALNGKPMLWYFQMTATEWDVKAASYKAARDQWGKLKESEEQATKRRQSNRGRDNARNATKQQWALQAEELDDDREIGIRYILVIAAALKAVNHALPHLLTEDLREAIPTFVKHARNLEDHNFPDRKMSGSDVPKRAICVGQSFLLALDLLCELEDRLGVQGVSEDWSERPIELHDMRTRVKAIVAMI